MAALTNSVNFTVNLTDSIPLNFKISDFTIYRVKIFKN
jgi:hypothetical protein